MIEKILKGSEVIIQTSATELKAGQPRRTTTTLLKAPNARNRGARLLIMEKEFTPRPDKQWTACGRTLHLTLKSNATHVQVMGYIRREEIQNNRQLGDMLCIEAEQLSSALEDLETLGKEEAV